LTDIEERSDSQMDDFLRRSMAGPVPALRADFDARLMRELRGGSRRLDRFGRILLGGYGATSVAVSAAVMRGQGLGWGVIASVTMAPLVVVGIVAWARREGGVRGDGELGAS
jgi:hypothetical protein